MTLLIDNRTNFELTDEIKETLEKVCLKSLQYEEFNEDCEISLSIVTNEEIHDINKQFRNIDSPTDVLSFPQLKRKWRNCSRRYNNIHRQSKGAGRGIRTQS